jgi:hypothetical protein
MPLCAWQSHSPLRAFPRILWRRREEHWRVPTNCPETSWGLWTRGLNFPWPHCTLGRKKDAEHKWGGDKPQGPLSHLHLVLAPEMLDNLGDFPSASWSSSASWVPGSESPPDSLSLCISLWPGSPGPYYLNREGFSKHPMDSATLLSPTCNGSHYLKNTVPHTGALSPSLFTFHSTDTLKWGQCI